MAQASFHDDAASVVKAIQDGVETQIIKIGEEEFTTRTVFLPPVRANTSQIEIHTLDGLANYLNENVDKHKDDNLVIIVNSPFSVSLASQIETSREPRMEWLEAVYQADGFPFDKFLDHETFMVKAQALIAEGGDRENLLKLVGNLTTALVQTSVDDGVSQTVTVEQGVRKANVELPNPIMLKPRRTFPEIDQPESFFVLRVRQSREGQMPEIALFEADGGLWRVHAIEEIKDYLKVEVKSDIPIIG